MKYPAYPKYKASGVEWLDGDGSTGSPRGVPEHWEVKRLKYQVSINDEAYPETMDPDFELVYVDISSVDSVEGIIKKEAMIFENAPSRARRIVRDGDTIISTVRTYLRAIAPVVKPEDNLTVSTGFAVVRPRSVDKNYLSKMLTAPYFVEEVVSRSVGVSYPAINASDIGLIQVPLPPLSEQQAIAAFLDRETRRIDTLICKKQKLIELLKGKRTALISAAVTGKIAIDGRGGSRTAPTKKMKPSGVEWLGDVPEHWKVKRLKHLFSIWGRIGFRGYTTEDLVDEGQGALVLGASHITDKGRVDPSEPVFITWQKYYESPEIMVSANDLIVVQRGSCGKVALVDFDLGPTTINPSLILLKNAKAYPKFILYVLLSGYMQSRIATLLSSTAVPMLSQEQVANFSVILPPLPEQQYIAAFLDRETKKIDTLAAKVEAAIEKLNEYRTALISAAVTGKIDVSTGLNSSVREVA